jgi:hypothetical protein
MIEVLQVATKSPVFGYKKMVEGNDADDSLSDYRKHNINVKALYLLAAYKEAKKEMSFKTQSKCCQDTILTLSKKPESITFISNREALDSNDGTSSFAKTHCFIPNVNPNMTCLHSLRLIRVWLRV